MCRNLFYKLRFSIYTLSDYKKRVLFKLPLSVPFLTKNLATVYKYQCFHARFIFSDISLTFRENGTSHSLGQVLKTLLLFSWLK